MHVLTCLAKGGPGNAFRWKRVGANEVIAESSELVMIIADASSGGVYQCTVENMAGMDSDIATINGEKRVHYRAGRMEVAMLISLCAYYTSAAHGTNLQTSYRKR